MGLEFCRRTTRIDRRNGYAKRSCLAAQRLGEATDTKFCSRIDSIQRRCGPASQRRHVDNMPTALLIHLRQDSTRDPDHTQEVHSNLCLNVFDWIKHLKPIEP